MSANTILGGSLLQLSYLGPENPILITQAPKPYTLTVAVIEPPKDPCKVPPKPGSNY